MPTFGSFFAGIGGLDLGLERAGWDCSWQVEKNEFCQRVLEARFPGVPRFGDIADLSGSDLTPVDLVCGGFPCQDISSAGLKVGIGGSRSGLWKHMARLIGELRPRFVLVENVGDLVTRGLDVVLGDLSLLGFDAEWSVVPACALGAPHPRRRLFLVAYAQGSHEPNQVPHYALSDSGETDRQGQSRGGRGVERWGRRWLPEPAVGRVAHGLPRRVVGPQLSALGNAAVPDTPEWIGRQLLKWMEAA